MAGRRRWLTAPAVVATVAVAVLVAGATPAGAIVHYRGRTWYSGGSVHRSGPSATTVTLYAIEAMPNHSYELFSSPFIPERDHERCGYSLTPVNPKVRVASASGVIGATTGQVSGPPGHYGLCFVDVLVPTDAAHPEGYYSAVYAWFTIT